MDERLLIEATDELLDGWCGPVVADAGADNCRSLVDGVHLNQDVTERGAIVWSDYGGVGSERIPIDDLFLDLSRAECRDRVARVVCGFPAALSAQGGWLWLCFEAGFRWPNDLDPHDDTRLPDGSRLVDALALAAVWREVANG